ncbi:MAG: PorV/PorQ family protein [candidate division FCPU426 bacterium]
MPVDKRTKHLLCGLWLAAAWLSPLPVAAVVADAGTNSPFELGAGSRALALGSGYTAVAEDVTSLFWNPAGLALLDQVEISAMHISLFYETPYDFLGVAYPLLDWGTFALGAVRLASGGILVRDERSHLTGVEGSLDLREYLLGYGRELFGGLRAGATVKIDQMRLLGDFDAGVGLDLGLHYRLPRDAFSQGGFDWSGLTFGLMLQNLVGPVTRLGAVEDRIPLNWKAGMAYRYRTQDSLKQQFLVCGAWERSTWRSSQFSGGLEYGVWDLLALRGGLNADGWTAGGGVQYAGLALDYALASEALGLTHRVTLSYRFGPRLSEQKAERERRREAELDKEAQRRAQEAVAKASEAMEQIMRNTERRHRREKQALIVQGEQQLAAERRRQAEQRKAAVADEYFKALHYFQGIEDYLTKNFKQALVEFETVEKYDPNYLQVQLYLARTRQQLGGQTRFMNDKSLQLYYQGIDFYVANDFVKAILVWNKILETEPNNLLVIRNIDEARTRIARMQAIQSEVEEEEKPPAPAPVKK